MNDSDKVKRKIDFKFTILIFQTVIFTLAILIMLLIKTLFGEFYGIVKKEYVRYFERRTSVEDILKPDEGIDSFDEGYTVYIE